ncbi:UDP-galactopyranose mutase (plasmid) [Azospirillum sp. TSH58]|uniref:UDP-galactopyranose mutase n=1 Tax=Azospirillum sp. TSH58 TaxID=664962 RepID=UPI000D6031F2|nr:UDP-galactopyranose mutase [Azospirillum sp. TSH58]AWJ85545.1 UDP-galactopyranose mutase [Azospirillum sp. TSH58]
MYDYLIVGSGLYGAVCARLLADSGRRVRVVERRNHIGGNVYTEEQEGIVIHSYGAHIFHCSNREIWDFVNRFASFRPFVNRPVSISGGKLYSLPFNMFTFNQLWGVTSPDEARAIIERERLILDREPENLEEQALSMVGKTIYDLLIRGYTMKQWQKNPRELPPWIIKRLPLRFTYDNNYFNDTYQGIPEGGYAKLIQGLLYGIQVDTSVDFLSNRTELAAQAKHVIYTGALDEFFGYDLGVLEYRGLRFEHDWFESENVLGNAVINYGDEDVPYTRRIEHRHFSPTSSPLSIVSREYPAAWRPGDIPFYPVNSPDNELLHRKYCERIANFNNYHIGGRLADYRYYDMHQVVGAAMKFARSLAAG